MSDSADLLSRELSARFAFLQSSCNGQLFVLSDGVVNGRAVVIFRHFDIVFTRDRGQTFLGFEATDRKRDPESGRGGRLEAFSIDVLRTHLTGEVAEDATASDSNLLFLKERWNEIAALFESDRWLITQAWLRELERDRAIRLFG